MKTSATTNQIVAADRFISLHPGHRDVAYAYYLKALDYYIQIVDVERDQRVTQQALDALVRRWRAAFPDSDSYARDAKLKMDLARDHLAGKEMDIGRYYEGQGEYLAAINRLPDRGQPVSDHHPRARKRSPDWSSATTRWASRTKRNARLPCCSATTIPSTAWYKATYELMTTGAETATAKQAHRSRLAGARGRSVRASSGARSSLPTPRRPQPSRG